ncbi:DUF2513 domain-containing protein [Tardiphaga sp. 1201_B9_N1_1]|uniref:DUF2513 domain-containing protein n=1 Tax=unclassified Tardiphaga TaxID=2631404 RepID=UPI000E755201
MKLDPDIVRRLLLDIEEQQDSPEWEMSIDNADYPTFYAASKLFEAGYVVAWTFPGSEPDEEYVAVRELTFAGHEFLDTVRDEKVWAAVKSGSKSVGSASLETLMAVGKGAMPIGTCPVCGSAYNFLDPSGDAHKVVCPIDGEFEVSGTVAATSQWQSATAKERKTFLEAAVKRTADGETVVIRTPLGG